MTSGMFCLFSARLWARFSPGGSTVSAGCCISSSTAVSVASVLSKTECAVGSGSNLGAARRVALAGCSDGCDDRGAMYAKCATPPDLYVLCAAWVQRSCDQVSGLKGQSPQPHCMPPCQAYHLSLRKQSIPVWYPPRTCDRTPPFVQRGATTRSQHLSRFKCDPLNSNQAHPRGAPRAAEAVLPHIAPDQRQASTHAASPPPRPITPTRPPRGR